VRLWDTKTGQCLKMLQGHNDVVWCVTFSPDGRTLASGGNDHTVRLWDASTGQCLRTLQGRINRLNGVAYSPNGQTVAGNFESSVRLWMLPLGNA